MESMSGIADEILRQRPWWISLCTGFRIKELLSEGIFPRCGNAGPAYEFSIDIPCAFEHAIWKNLHQRDLLFFRFPALELRFLMLATCPHFRGSRAILEWFSFALRDTDSSSTSRWTQWLREKQVVRKKNSGTREENENEREREREKERRKKAKRKHRRNVGKTSVLERSGSGRGLRVARGRGCVSVRVHQLHLSLTQWPSLPFIGRPGAVADFKAVDSSGDLRPSPI